MLHFSARSAKYQENLKIFLHYHTTIWLVAYFVWSLKQCHGMSDTTGIPCFIFSSYELIMQIPFQRLRI